MSVNTTLQFDHDFLDKLAAFIASKKRQHVLAELMFDAISGNPESAEILERRFGLKIVAQGRVRAPSIAPTVEPGSTADV